MSAYGAISSKGHIGRPPLPTTRWATRDRATGSQVFIDTYHFTLQTALESPGLLGYLHSVFAQVVEDGRTYPMEVAEGEAYPREAFESYFFAADVVVGVIVGGGRGDGFAVDDRRNGVEIVSGADGPFGPSGSSKDGNPPVWKDIVVGFYYAGRSFVACERTADLLIS